MADSFNFFNINEPTQNETQENNVEVINISHQPKLQDENIKPILTKSNSLSKDSRKSSINITPEVTLVAHSQTKTQCSNITELPNEILNIILTYLDLRTLFNLRATCKHFYDICSDEYFFQRLDLQPYWHFVNDDLIELLSSLTNDVKMINFSWLKLSSKLVLENFFVNSCQSLITLKLDNCLFVDEEILKIIGINCLNLENLSLIGCMNNKLKNNETLSLNSENNITNGNDFSFLKNLRKLVNLNLYRSAIDTDSIMQILTACTNLKHLNLGSCVNINDFDLVMGVLSANCKEIESLDLWRAYALTNVGLNNIANNCVNLVELDIGWW